MHSEQEKNDLLSNIINLINYFIKYLAELQVHKEIAM